MGKVYIKVSKDVSDARRVLINWAESCEKDSWEPLNPLVSIRVKVFEKEEVGHIGPDADWLACYLDCESVYKADYISQTDEIHIDALDKEAHSRTVKLNCVCFEVTDGARRSFKKLSISRMTWYEVRALESMYRNAHKDTRRTEPRVFRLDPCNTLANLGVDITVFDPEKALESGKKYFGNLHLVIVPGEMEPRFEIVYSNCSRAEAYPEYFDKTKRVYQFPSSPESSFNLADIRYVKRVGARLFGNTVCGEWVHFDTIPELTTSLSDKIERDDDVFSVCPELLEDEVSYTCHYWPEKDCLVLDDLGKQHAMYLHAMYLAARFSADIWARKNADCSVPKINRVIFNAPAVIVMWADGSKTVVKAQNGEKFDPEKGLAMAISKKALGNGSKYYDTFKAWVPEKKKPARKPKAKKTPTEE